MCFRFVQEFGDTILFIASSVVRYATDQLQGITSAIMWPLALSKFGYIIDNPWGICVPRSVEVGKHLGYVLMEKHYVSINSSIQTWMNDMNHLISMGTLMTKSCLLINLLNLSDMHVCLFINPLINLFVYLLIHLSIHSFKPNENQPPIYLF